MAVGDRFDPGREIGTAVAIVEADAEPGLRAAGDDVVRRVADIQVGDFDVRGLEPVGALVERQPLDLGEDRDQPGNRLVGAVWVGDLPLLAGPGAPVIYRAPPPDFDRLSEPTPR